MSQSEPEFFELGSTLQDQGTLTTDARLQDWYDRCEAWYAKAERRGSQLHDLPWTAYL